MRIIRYTHLIFLSFLVLSCTSRNKSLPITNVVYIVGDDHADYVLGCYGNQIINTPNLDRLAGEGVRFTKAYSTSPVCTPSRQSILTARYPHANGVSLLTSRIPESEVTIAHHLKQFGYKTQALGKNHFHGKLYGFDALDYDIELPAITPVADDIPVMPTKIKFVQRPASAWLNSKVLPFKSYDKDMKNTHLAQKAAKYIKDNKNSKFFIMVSFDQPHCPFRFPIEYAGKYKPEDMPIPGANEVSSEDDRMVPWVFRDMSDDDKRGAVASYYTAVEYLDKNVGIVLDAIKENGLEENTMVVYLGDQGYLLGHHKRFEKHTMWEEAVKGPLIIKAGNRFKAGTVVTCITSFIDVMPTVLDVLDLPPMERSQGKSFVPVIKGKKRSYRDYVYSEFLVDNKAMVRDATHKYIYTTGSHDLGQGYKTGEGPMGVSHRLYDLENDPKELHSVDREQSAVMARLKKQMLKWFSETHSQAEFLPQKLSEAEQLEWYCLPPEKMKDKRIVTPK